MDFLIYLLKSTLLLSLFLGVYEFFLKRETFFALNRYFLLGGIFTAACLPAISWEKTVVVYKYLRISTASSSLQNIPVTKPVSLSFWQQLDYAQLLLVVYIVVLVFLGIKFLQKYWQLYSTLRKQQVRRRENGICYIETTEDLGPFSFFNTVVYNPSLCSKEEREFILQHEQTHVKKLHSVDLVVANLVAYLNWFNPLVWLYRKRMLQNLEFLADRSVTATLQSSKAYQLSLVRRATVTHSALPVTSFQQSFLKTRIAMLHKNKSRKSAYLKLGFILPLIAVFFFTFQVKTVAQVRQKVKQEKPHFNGNLSAYISKNLHYPEAAREDSVSGRVYVKFTVERDGSIADVKVLRGRGLGHGLAQEAVRVVKNMPPWTPGKINGKTVRTSYILPFHFNISNSSKKSQKVPSPNHVPASIPPPIPPTPPVPPAIDSIDSPPPPPAAYFGADLMK